MSKVSDVKLFSELSAIPEIVVASWIDCEKSPNATNPLGILYGGTDRPLQLRSDADGYGVYPDSETGLRDAWGILQLPPYERIRRAIATGDPLTITNAIEHSSWNASHYGGTPDGFADGKISELITNYQE